MSEKQMNEEENKRLGQMIFALARGDISALESIYTMMSKLLYAIGNAHFKQKADIEDAIHDLLILLYRNAHIFRKNKNACAWIVKMFQNSIRSRLRRCRTETEYLAAHAHAAAACEGKDDLKYIENHLFIRQIFEKLTDYEQDLMIYRYWGGFTIREVADILEKPKSTVESQLKNLEEKIRKF